MTGTCDLCHSTALEPIYEPVARERGLTVHLCADCGLVQSLPRADRKSAADRGNIRHRETFHAEASLALIRAQEDLRPNLRVLDVGSNGDSFARVMLAAVPEARLTCVEPDEDISLPDDRFDIVHACGMIEQRVSPASTLARYWRVLKADGLLIINAPNIALIDGGDIAEEWFVDTQLYHFSQQTLARLLKAAGFEIVAGPDSKDGDDLLFAARKRKRPARSERRDPGEVDRALALISSYVTNRVRTLRAA